MATPKKKKVSKLAEPATESNVQPTKKATSTATNESNMASELRNTQHIGTDTGR